jgi:hypothetical protein
MLRDHQGAAEAAHINSIAKVPFGLTASGSYKQNFVRGKTYRSSLDTHQVSKYGLLNDLTYILLNK